jgi:uncharacterized membrane protein
MKNPLESLEKALAIGFVLAVLAALVLHGSNLGNEGYWLGVLRFAHILVGILWIGLLYYFNFVQIPNMPKIPDEHKPAISKVIAPAALFFFRWAALATILIGLILAAASHYIVDALTLQGPQKVIGLGMWLGLIMGYNVWMVIWPNQKKALGIVEATPDEKKKAGRTAMLFSRTNTVLSIPMLYCMVGYQHMG